jgi:hypothetical protein
MFFLSVSATPWFKKGIINRCHLLMQEVYLTMMLA